MANAYIGSASFTDATWKDWGVTDAEAYLKTGHENLQDTQRKKQSIYLSVDMIPTDIDQGDSRKNYTFNITAENTGEFTYTAHNELFSGDTIGQPIHAFAYDSLRDVVYAMGNNFDTQIYEFDASDLSFNRTIGIASWGGGGTIPHGMHYNESTDELWIRAQTLSVGERIRKLNCTTFATVEYDSIDDIVYPVDNYGFDYIEDDNIYLLSTSETFPTNGRFILVDADTHVVLDSRSGAEMLQPTQGPGTKAWHPGQYYYADFSDGLRIYDTNFQYISGSGIGLARSDIAMDVDRNIYYTGKNANTVGAYGALTRTFYATGIAWQTGGEPTKRVPISANVTVDDSGSPTTISGEVVKAVLEMWIGNEFEFPSNYLDYVHGFTYTDSTGTLQETFSGFNSFFDEGISDSFSDVSISSTVTVMASDGLFSANTVSTPIPEEPFDSQAETSSCLVTASWDYANNPLTEKVGQQFEAYRPQSPIRYITGQNVQYLTDVVVSKNKIRGRGRALNLDFRTQENKDCQLLGWAINFIGASSV